MLNRIVRWTERGLAYEADPRQAEKLIDELGLLTMKGTSEVKALSTPSTKITVAQTREDKPLAE